MTNKELIAEARKFLDDYPHYQEYPGGPLLKYPHQDSVERLADALEASEARIAELEAKLAARQPSEDGKYILRLIETIKQTGGSVEVAGVKIMPCDEFGRTAAVPDAAIRELTEAIRLTVEYVGNDMLPAIEGWDWYDALVKYAPEVAQAFVDKPIHFPKPTNAGAERDAALAAIERCRGVLASWKSVQASNREHFESGNLGMIVPFDCVGGLSAALDGAPEPEEVEWEYGVRNRLTWKVGFPYSREEVADRIDDENRRVAGTYYVMRFEAVRRRKAGPWEPVEGESK